LRSEVLSVLKVTVGATSVARITKPLMHEFSIHEAGAHARSHELNMITNKWAQSHESIKTEGPKMASYRFPDDTCNVAKLNPVAAPVGILVDDEYLPFGKLTGDLRAQIKDALDGSLTDFVKVELMYSSPSFWVCELVAKWDEAGEADSYAVAVMASEAEAERVLKDNEEEGTRRSDAAFLQDEDSLPDDPAPGLERGKSLRAARQLLEGTKVRVSGKEALLFAIAHARTRKESSDIFSCIERAAHEAKNNARRERALILGCWGCAAAGLILGVLSSWALP
jgi:hypothetical protein